MYCGNCGKPIEDGAQFCGECGARTEDSALGAANMQRPNVRSEVRPDRGTQPSLEFKSEYSAKKKSNFLIPIIIFLICLCVAAAGAIVFLLLRNDDDVNNETNTEMAVKNNDNSTNLQSDRVEKKDGLVIVTVDAYPSETQVNPYVLTGTMSSKENAATLTINGQKIGSVTKVDGTIVWEAEAQLVEGDNIIKILLEDSAGNTDEKTVAIKYTEAWPFPYGTELTRTSGETNYMILVRPGPSKSSGEPLLKIMPGDFVTTLIYLGEYQEENSQTSGHHYWYKVELPDGREGWIRDDLAMRKENN